MADYSYCRRIDHESGRNVHENVRMLDEEMAKIGFVYDLGSYRAGEEVGKAVDCFVDIYGFEVRQCGAVDRQSGEALEGFITVYGKG
jgi:hypothetical protein